MFVVFNWCRPKLILFEVFVKSSSQLVYVECIVYALDITSVVVGAGTNVSPRTKTPRWLPDSRVLPPRKVTPSTLRRATCRGSLFASSCTHRWDPISLFLREIVVTMRRQVRESPSHTLKGCGTPLPNIQRFNVFSKSVMRYSGKAACDIWQSVMRYTVKRHAIFCKRS